MKPQRTLLIAVLCLLAGTAIALTWFRTHQKLGAPGIKAAARPGSIVMAIELPERVLDFTSTNVPQPKTVLDMLPKDTSFANRLYVAPDGFWVAANIVLMGKDRTSIHKPEYCLPGQGWRIDSKDEVALQIGGAAGYQLPVAKWVASAMLAGADGQKQNVRGIYVFWFVADNEQTTRHGQRVWWMARDLLRTGVLQRWAYVSYFAACPPGQEDAAFERVKQLIAASVPDFQLPPASAKAAVAARQ